VKNLDFPISPIKNWFNIPLLLLRLRKDLKMWMGFGKFEENILDVINVEFPNEIEDHVKDCVQSWHMYPYFGSVMFNLQMEFLKF
jgi:hypothetical protein